MNGCYEKTLLHKLSTLKDHLARFFNLQTLEADIDYKCDMSDDLIEAMAPIWHNLPMVSPQTSPDVLLSNMRQLEPPRPLHHLPEYLKP